MARRTNTLAVTAGGTEEALLTRLSRQAAKLEDAHRRVRDERDRLDLIVADAVTTEPMSVTWYAHPGPLTLDQVIATVGGGAGGVHKAMERYRKRFATKPRRRPRG